MAQSFWSKRKTALDSTGGYIKSTNAVSKPVAGLMTVLGILVVGGLLFGVFWGARWGFEKLSSNDTPAKVTTSNQNSGSTSSASTTTGNSGAPATTPDITATSSTATTTPSSATPPAPAVLPATTNRLPHTGPESTATFFFGTLIISYLIYRKKLLKSS